LWLCLALSLSLFLFSAAESQFLRNVFYLHCTLTTHLDCFTAVPYSPRTWSGLLHEGHSHKVASRLNNLKVLLRVCSSFKCKTGCSLNTAIAVLPAGQALSQPAPADWTRSAAHFWQQHLSGVTAWPHLADQTD